MDKPFHVPDEVHFLVFFHPQIRMRVLGPTAEPADLSMHNKSIFPNRGQGSDLNLLPVRERPTDAHARLDHHPEQDGTVDREVHRQEETHKSDHVPRHAIRTHKDHTSQDQVDREGRWL